MLFHSAININNFLLCPCTHNSQYNNKMQEKELLLFRGKILRKYIRGVVHL